MQTCLITFPEFIDDRGTLTVIEDQLPFEVRRIFYMYGMPSHAARGNHALKTCEQVVVPLAGGFSVTVLDGVSRRSYRLDEPARGLYLPPLVWRVLHTFELGTVCLVLASEPYDASGYYRAFVDFLMAIRGQHA